MGEPARFISRSVRNVASDFGALFADTTGNLKVAIGERAGFNPTSGSDKIEISNPGVARELRATRIGNEGQRTKAFIARVYKKPVATSA